MDPALRQLTEIGGNDDEIAVLVRFAGGADPLPAGIRIVARFGDIATIRAPRSAVQALRAHPAIASVKAPRLYRADLVVEEPVQPLGPRPPELPGPPGPPGTGRGVVIGMVDWGLDFTHPDFRDPNGRTRLLALWDQQPGPDATRPNRYGYGRIFSQQDIDTALRQPDPIAALGYDFSASDLGTGTHGTATTSIAGGSGASGAAGMAPDADIVFVHFSTWGPAGPQNLGDSAALVEAIDFIIRTAAGRPWVVNLSLGRQAGSHDGSSLVERALDAAVTAGPGRMIVQSCGNYYHTDIHTAGELLPGATDDLVLLVDPDIQDMHEVDLWYAGADRMLVGVCAPDGRTRTAVRPGASAVLRLGDLEIARITHRLDDPNNGRNQIVIRIAPTAPGGDWHIILSAIDILDGRYNAWVERESLHPHTQAHFAPAQAVRTTTTGTICNGVHTVTVGAYDPHEPQRPVAAFSSSGPTTQGLYKPQLLAPGRSIPAARSRARDESNGTPLSTIMSGTSLAAPYVTGTIACLMEILGRRATAARLRLHLLTSCEPYPERDNPRVGNGYLDPVAAIRYASGSGTAVTRRRAEAGSRTGESIEEHADLESTPTRGLADAAYNCSDTETGDAMTEPSPIALVPPTGAPSAPDSSPLPRPEPPSAILRSLGVTARDLFDVFVLDRRPDVRERIEGRAELVAGPHDTLSAAHGGDLLIRGHVGEGHASLATLVDGDLINPRTARERGWTTESTVPGRYAWVIEDGDLPRPREDEWARRITDRRGFVLPGHAIIRVTRTAAKAENPRPGPVQVPLGETAGASSGGLRSPRFAGDADLEAVRRGELRLAAAGTWQPVPIRSSGAAIVKMQQALIDLGYPLPRSGADGRFGHETGTAVAKFKADRGISPSDPVVGPQTITALDTDIAAHDTPGPAPTPPAPVPASPTLPFSGPPFRPCCMLADSALRGESTVGRHDELSPGTVYTGKAGFVDFGHVWDNCDLTAWLYQQISSATGAAGTVLNIREGTVRLTGAAPPAEWLTMARSIAFDEGLAHEISSYWAFTPGGHNSSFSPEDLCSNFLGTLVAERALIAGGNFVTAAEREARSLLASLDAQNDAETRNAFALISSRWVDTSLIGTVVRDGYLRRRNFTQVPWKTGHRSDSPTPTLITTPIVPIVKTAVGYDYTHKTMGFTRATRAAEIGKIMKDASNRYGPDFDKP